VTKSELGTKRICGSCNSKFYDLHKSPIVCPVCQIVFTPPSDISEKSRRPWEARTTPAQQPVREHTTPDAIAGDVSDEEADEEKEADEEGAGVDEDFENFEKE